MKVKLIQTNKTKETDKHLSNKFNSLSYKKILNKHILPSIKILNKYKIWILIN
uniref:Cytochrome b6-f complex subunit PetP n=1 Tax=Polysiphonia scopulorum TaxID=257860 RepID=A0A1Z1MHR0_9FLOR|nr:cytochrome b6-f complex subunit PetP [Polysiphonia scopulorum]ARW65620.1 cytochrome b6-f complex subunit PetP [Polysiphonia scopulorum]